MKEKARFTILVALALSCVLILGTAGYYLIEPGWSLLDSLYMTVITITTVGFGETHELSSVGRVFTVGLILVGVAAVGFVGSHAARLLIDSELELVLGRGKMDKAIQQLNDHYIVCGYGRIGSTICAELERLELDFVIVEHDEELVKQSEDRGYLVKKANATTDRALESVGIERAVGVVAALSDDADNLFISLAARELNPKVLIVSRVEQKGVEDRMLRAGADKVVSPLILGGQQIARIISENHQSGGMLETIGDFGSASGFRLCVLHQKDGGAKTVGDAIETTNAMTALALRRADGSTETMPHPDTVLAPRDAVILCIDGRSADRSLMKDKVSPKRVLIVDDQKALRLQLVRKLRAAGHTLTVAASGEEALAVASDVRPQLIALHATIPGTDSYKTCSELRQMPELAHSRVVLYSVEDNDDSDRKGLEAGADTCLRKGHRTSELLSKIQEVLAAA
jgi:Trk K+ transport system NAD-binding subunit/CheY-like chemotaxis protein